MVKFWMISYKKKILSTIIGVASMREECRRSPRVKVNFFGDNPLVYSFWMHFCYIHDDWNPIRCWLFAFKRYRNDRVEVGTISFQFNPVLFNELWLYDIAEMKSRLTTVRVYLTFISLSLSSLRVHIIYNILWNKIL